MSTKSGYHIDGENDAWARRQAALRGTSKSEIGRDALTLLRRSIDAVPPVSKVRPIKVPGTPKSTPAASKDIGRSISPSEIEADFWRVAALKLILEAHGDQSETHDLEPPAGDSSSVAARKRISGRTKLRYVLPRGSLVRVRRRDGSFYLATVC